MNLFLLFQIIITFISSFNCDLTHEKEKYTKEGMYSKQMNK